MGALRRRAFRKRRRARAGTENNGVSPRTARASSFSFGSARAPRLGPEPGLLDREDQDREGEAAGDGDQAVSRRHAPADQDENRNEPNDTDDLFHAGA